MQINLAEVSHIRPKCSRSSIKIRDFYPNDQTTTFRFIKDQELTITRNPPSFIAKVLIEGQLQTRTPPQPDWQVGQFDFATRRSFKTTVVTIFRNPISQTTLPSHQKPEKKN